MNAHPWRRIAKCTTGLFDAPEFLVQLDMSIGLYLAIRAAEAMVLGSMKNPTMHSFKVDHVALDAGGCCAAYEANGEDEEEWTNGNSFTDAENLKSASIFSVDLDVSCQTKMTGQGEITIRFQVSDIDGIWEVDEINIAELTMYFRNIPMYEEIINGLP